MRMYPNITRRNFLFASVGAMTLVGCVSPQSSSAMYEADSLKKPVFVFDDAVAYPKGSDSFIGELTGEKLKYFDKIFFVNKSPWGVYSQTLKILEPDTPGVENTAWRVTQTLDVSTGRERQEHYFTTTPRGVFTFDKNRRHREYYSMQWGGAAMPFAMFWDYIYPNGRPTGIAFHSTTENTELFLGLRASGGCIRLSMTQSEEIFDMVGSHAGKVPDFVDRDPRGVLSYHKNGSVRMKDGFRVLVVVEDNKNIRWDPFVSDGIWQRRLDNKKAISKGSDYSKMLSEMAGQD